MDTVLKTINIVLGIILAVILGYGIIYLINQALYQIFIHTERTLLILTSIWVIYGGIYIIRKNK